MDAADDLGHGAESAGARVMTRWDYYTIVLEPGMFSGGEVDAEKLQETLSELGRDGWELVSLFDTNRHQGGTAQVVGVLKRPRV